MTSPRGSSLPKERVAELELGREGHPDATISLPHGGLFLSCNFELDMSCSFQMITRYSTEHTFFTTFQAILLFPRIHNLICVGFMGQNRYVLTWRVCGTVNVVHVTYLDLAGGLERVYRVGRGHMGGAEG